MSVTHVHHAFIGALAPLTPIIIAMLLMKKRDGTLCGKTSGPGRMPPCQFQTFLLHLLWKQPILMVFHLVMLFKWHPTLLHRIKSQGQSHGIESHGQPHRIKSQGQLQSLLETSCHRIRSQGHPLFVLALPPTGITPQILQARLEAGNHKYQNLSLKGSTCSHVHSQFHSICLVHVILPFEKIEVKVLIWFHSLPLLIQCLNG